MLMDEDGSLMLGYAVRGFACEKCHEKLIDRQTMRALQYAQTPVIAWSIGGTATTHLNEVSSGLISYSPSTAQPSFVSA